MSNPKCLLFHLAGPMCSWGETAVGNYRPTGNHPTKSALAGILAASLGLDRFDSLHQNRLFTDYDYVVVSTGAESEMIDYSTTESSETPNEERSVLPPRSLELSREKRNTIVIDRRYTCNGYYSVIVVPHQAPAYSLDELKSALEKPHYTPYLGRKSCPLMFPMLPTIEDFADPKALILSKTCLPFKEFTSTPETQFSNGYHVYSTFKMDCLGASSEHVRADDHPERRTWQFYERPEYEYQVVCR